MQRLIFELLAATPIGVLGKFPRFEGVIQSRDRLEQRLLIVVYFLRVRFVSLRSLSYPEAANELNLGEVTCRVRVYIDESGVPYNIEIEACPMVFHESAKEALYKWRWYPAKVEGTKVKAQFPTNKKTGRPIVIP